MAAKTNNPFGIDLKADDLELLGSIAELGREKDTESAFNNDLPVGVYNAALLGGTWGRTSTGENLKFTWSFAVVGGDYHGKTRKITRVIKGDDNGDSYLRVRHEAKTFGVDAVDPVEIVDQLAETEDIECGLVVTAGTQKGSVFYKIVSKEALEEYLDE